MIVPDFGGEFGWTGNHSVGKLQKGVLGIL